MMDRDIESSAQAVGYEPRRGPYFVNGSGYRLPAFRNDIGFPPPHRDMIDSVSGCQSGTFVSDREIRKWLDVDQGRIVRLQAEELVPERVIQAHVGRHVSAGSRHAGEPEAMHVTNCRLLD